MHGIIMKPFWTRLSNRFLVLYKRTRLYKFKK